MFRMIPDLDLLDSMLASQNADWISITVRGLAEMKGVQTDENGRFHHVSNAYVADLALFPTLGQPIQPSLA